jgi:polyisoprenyl-phosphate glycosyltransferase
MVSEQNQQLAIIIPVFNEGKYVRKNYLEIRRVLEQDGVQCRFLFVDDGSADDTWQELVQLTQAYEDTAAIRFARNFGKEIALSAGINSIDADLYLTMDSDLQHPPRYIKQMLETMKEKGVNIVEGVKLNRGKESASYKFVAKSFYRLLRSITGLELDNSSDFKVMDREVVDALRSFHERNLFFRGIVGWVGFKTHQLAFEVEERAEGESRFPIGKLMILALNAILSHTSKPLYLTIFSGLLFLSFAILLGIQTLYNYFSGHAVSGFSTVIILVLITGSMIMLSLGIIGVYISRIYEEIKGRPRYIISEKTP